MPNLAAFSESAPSVVFVLLIVLGAIAGKQIKRWNGKPRRETLYIGSLLAVGWVFVVVSVLVIGDRKNDTIQYISDHLHNNPLLLFIPILGPGIILHYLFCIFARKWVEAPRLRRIGQSSESKQSPTRSGEVPLPRLTTAVEGPRDLLCKENREKQDAHRAVVNDSEFSIEDSSKTDQRKSITHNELHVAVTEHKCRRCGRDCRPEFRYCPDCGAELTTLACTNCGRIIEKTAKYCPFCCSAASV